MLELRELLSGLSATKFCKIFPVSLLKTSQEDNYATIDKGY